MKAGDATEAVSVTLNVQPHDHSPQELCFTVTLTSPQLRPFPRSERQIDLLRRAVSLRELDGLTYAAIAERLTTQGYVGARGAKLTAEGVYALLRKGKTKDRRTVR